AVRRPPHPAAPAGAQPARAVPARAARVERRREPAVAGVVVMRIGKVVGRITMQPVYETLVGGRYLIVEVQDRFALAGKKRKTTESLVCYDHLGANMGD